MAQLDVHQLPLRADTDFGPRIRRLDALLDRPEEDFRAGLANGDWTVDQRFACLYGLLHRMRREYRFQEYRDLLHEHEREFGNEPYFQTFRVVLTRWTGDDMRGMLTALEPSERAVRLIPRDPGVLHQYAELVASLGEVDRSAARKYIEKAFERVNEAIDMAPVFNAVYYSTRARLDLITGDLDSARTDIERAIAAEDSQSPDYARRISRYESIRLLIIIRQQEEGLEARQRAVLMDLDQFKSQQLSMLSLLAALIALLAVTASIATRVNATEAARLIVTSGGVIIIAFGAVAAVLIGSPMRRVAVALSIGIALVLIALITRLA